MGFACDPPSRCNGASLATKHGGVDRRLYMSGHYVVAGGGELKFGEIYEVRHSRKGRFRLKITRLDGEWITGQIVSGVAKALLRYNVREEGEEITIRDVHSYFIPVA